MTVRIQAAASFRLDEIYRYTRDRWGDNQAETYITGLFETFERIETQGVISRPVPAEFGPAEFDIGGLTALKCTLCRLYICAAPRHRR